MSNEGKGSLYQLKFIDISAATFGKYQFCTRASDGMYYADSDFSHGGGCGFLKWGALPSPHQDTPELTAKAQALHVKAARKLVRKSLLKNQSIWKRITSALTKAGAQ